MIKVILLLFLILNIINADEFDRVSDENKKNILYPLTEEEISEYTPLYRPMTKEEIRKYRPLIPRMLTIKEQKQKEAKQKAEKDAKARAKADKKAKIDTNFAKKETLQKVEKIKVEVKADAVEVDFFDSLDDSSNKPVNME